MSDSRAYGVKNQRFGIDPRCGFCGEKIDFAKHWNKLSKKVDRILPCCEECFKKKEE